MAKIRKFDDLFMFVKLVRLCTRPFGGSATASSQKKNYLGGEWTLCFALLGSFPLFFTKSRKILYINTFNWPKESATKAPKAKKQNANAKSKKSEADSLK